MKTFIVLVFTAWTGLAACSLLGILLALVLP
jgi:hypothetical protein